MLDVLNVETKALIITAKSADSWGRDQMGKVAVIIRMMPSNEVNFEKLLENIQNLKYIQKIEEKPIAFGIKAIEATALIEDAEGGTDSIEKELSLINGVQSVEVIDISLI